MTVEPAQALEDRRTELAQLSAVPRVQRKRARIDRMVPFDTEQGRQRLAELLRTAVERVPYYRAFAGAGFADFPVMGKTELRAHFADLISRDPTGEIGNGRFFLNQTSGSTGQPVRSLTTTSTGGMANAALHERLNRQLGFPESGTVLNLGLLYPDTPLFEAVPLPRPYVKCNLRGFDPTSPSVVADYEAVVGRFPVDKITGSSSRVIALARYCAERGIRLRPHGVVASYEHMPDSGRQVVESTFGCRVTMLYMTSETGYSAWECPERRMHFQDDFVLPEFLNEEAGVSDIALSSLTSTPMPILRYVTGDRAGPVVSCGCGLPGTAVESLLGRAKTGFVGLAGEIYAPWALLAALSAAGLPDFQLVQEEAGWLDLVVPSAGPRPAEVLTDLNTRLRAAFQPREGFQLRVRAAGGFVLTDTGKRNPIVQRLALPAGPERSGYV
ncbi:Phenylacetate-coenzyme A ligase PaaK, adenylate-forming domain family [Amycolatopsis xylanica]|uniref:Phenylacetate-coenzyme A ligase PaaK, adenylate-forming domain family n=2 Tax=Amycolatopsis xylanica TaxID=589385 RepID=A0A1H3PJF1_9PSEU|nr:Phenylacetate-coenzyme A ligase PaaK, adenylate-forming domain family [Amycolatopsis xylanica]